MTRALRACGAGPFVFGEAPAAAAVLGAAIIVGAGPYVWRRERLGGARRAR
jgi:hypothetical protein